MTTNSPQFQGSMVALATPMAINGDLDWQALSSLVDFHLNNGTDAIVAVGTSGESPTLSVEEHMKVVEAVVKQVAGRIPVIAGTGANSTSEAVEWTQEAKVLGADGCLLVVPYYNKPTQEGLFQHFSLIADSVDIPQILYNVPGRTITDMDNEVIIRLSQHANIVGIKDATGDTERAQEVIDNSADDFFVYSGDDLTAYDLMLRGGKGNISVTANIMPAVMSELCRLAISGDRAQTEALQNTLLPLHEALFVESNPIPVKWAMAEMGLMPAGIRLPLTPLSDNAQPVLREAMAALDLLNA